VKECGDLSVVRGWRPLPRDEDEIAPQFEGGIMEENVARPTRLKFFHHLVGSRGKPRIRSCATPLPG
jgi:hypothetical protein